MTKSKVINEFPSEQLSSCPTPGEVNLKEEGKGKEDDLALVGNPLTGAHIKHPLRGGNLELTYLSSNTYHKKDICFQHRTPNNRRMVIILRQLYYQHRRGGRNNFLRRPRQICKLVCQLLSSHLQSLSIHLFHRDLHSSS
jgi:hypothetical protein